MQQTINLCYLFPSPTVSLPLSPPLPPLSSSPPSLSSLPSLSPLSPLSLLSPLSSLSPGNRPGSIQPKVASPSPALVPSDQSFTPEPQEMMREMWLSSRDNVNLLFEICHQVCLHVHEERAPAKQRQ